MQLLVCGASARTHGEKQPEAVSTCCLKGSNLETSCGNSISKCLLYPNPLMHSVENSRVFAGDSVEI